MKMKIIIVNILILLNFTGCIVGDVVALPFRAVGSVAYVVTPDIVGDTIVGAGDTLDTAIPF